jgi:outer membrane protein
MRRNKGLSLAAWPFVMLAAAHTQVQASAPAGLLDVYQMAVLHDAQLAQKRAEYQANQQVIDKARAVLLPAISADAGYKLDDLDDTDLQSRSLSLTLNQPLYNHAAWAGYEQAKYALEQSEYTLKAAEQDLIVRTSDVFFKVLLAQEDLRLSQAQEEADKIQWERAVASAEVGLASRTDVLQAKSSYDLSRSNRISAENGLDVAKEELLKLTGQPIERLKGLALNVALPKEVLDIVEWESRAQSDNLNVKNIKSQLDIASEEIEVQKGGHWPTANLQAQYSDMDYMGYPSTGTTFNDRQNTSVGVSVSLPLYAGGGTSARVSEARYQQQAASQAYRDSQEQARLNARTQVRTVERGQSLIAALREAVNSNQAFLEAAEESYRVGLKSLLEVLTARSNFFNARRNLVEALHNQVLNRLNLEAAVGDLQADDLQTYDALLTEVSAAE